MADLIVRLYDLKNVSHQAEILKESGVRIFRPLGCSKKQIIEFVENNFSKQWADECEASFSRLPITMFVAVNREGEVVGFASYEATNKAFFGPTGVREDYRHKKIGGELLNKSLEGLRELGYAYGIIGGTGEEIFPFYHGICGAEIIAGSDEGIYSALIKKP